MTLVGRIRFLDDAKVERGLVEVWVEGEVITLAMQRDGAAHRLHISANAADRISGHLDRAASMARGA